MTMTTQTTSPAPVAEGRAMKTRHPVLVWLLWPALTFGIYTLVWYYKIHAEMAAFDRRAKVPAPVGPMLVLFLLGWTLIAPLVSYYNTGQSIRTAQRAAGLEQTCSPAFAMLLAFVFGLNFLYLQVQLNKVTEFYATTEGEPIDLYV